MKITVIIPTYNECENIGELIRALQEVFRQLSHDMHILVVDDNSPDGTAAIVQKLMTEFPNIDLITGPKNGLGAAYIRGMRYAMESMNADIVFEMDADFSHHPEDIGRFIKAIEAGADFVIGSRFVAGGGIPDNWGIHRRMISRWGNIFARYIGGLYKIKDCTSGFRAIRTDVLQKIQLEKLKVKGYAFQVALLAHAVAKDAAVEEIPIEFTDREKGETKLGLYDILESMFNAWRIRLETSRSIWRKNRSREAKTDIRSRPEMK